MPESRTLTIHICSRERYLKRSVSVEVSIPSACASNVQTATLFIAMLGREDGLGLRATQHICPGQRELTKQERNAWSPCTSISPKLGEPCIHRGPHQHHTSYSGVETWLNDWQQPQQHYQLTLSNKQATDLGGLLSEIIWEQRRMKL
jgi:hypothetical protein